MVNRKVFIVYMRESTAKRHPEGFDLEKVVN